MFLNFNVYMFYSGEDQIPVIQVTTFKSETVCRDFVLKEQSNPDSKYVGHMIEAVRYQIVEQVGTQLYTKYEPIPKLSKVFHLSEGNKVDTDGN